MRRLQAASAAGGGAAGSALPAASEAGCASDSDAPSNEGWQGGSEWGDFEVGIWPAFFAS